MTRRSMKRLSQYNINLTDLLNGNIVDKNDLSYLENGYELVICDDRKKYCYGDIVKILPIIDNYFSRKGRIVFNNLFVDSYDEVLNLSKNNKLLKACIIDLKDRDEKKLYGYDKENPLVPIFVNIKEEELGKVPLDFYKNINNGNKTVPCFDRRILSDDDFIFGIKTIVSQINDNSKNDIQKVLLLNKMLRENVLYDKEYYYKTRHNENHFEVNKSHIAQTVLRDRCAVCNAISYFALYILENLGIECNVVNGTCCNEGHAWNEIKIGDKWYSCDFTHSLWLDKDLGIRYILVSNPSKNHVKDTNINYHSCHTIDREYLKQQMDQIKDIHINMPLYASTDFISYNNSFAYDSKSNTRRKANCLYVDENNNQINNTIILGRRRKNK